jgi:histidyl-tRNA synthetase
MVADGIMRAYGATDDMYKIKLNSRKLLEFAITDYLGVDSDKAVDVIRLLDRVNKMDKMEFSHKYSELTGKPESLDKLWELIENSNNLDRLPSELKVHESYKELKSLSLLLAKSGVLNAEFDITLARGFDYYTDIVFEVFDTNPDNNRSLFGGGRYDGLVAAFGVEPVPTVGFGMGDVTIKDFIETHNLVPELPHDIQLCVILIGEDSYLKSQDLLKELRDAGVNVAVDSTNRKMDKQLKSAAKAGYAYVLFAGDQELESGEFKLKNLESGQEQTVAAHEIVDFIRSESN